MLTGKHGVWMIAAVFGLTASLLSSEAVLAGGCKSGYVWRDAKNGDGVCVTPDERAEAKKQNAAAAFTGKKGRGCRDGYVWRDAWNGDGVCVTPHERTKAKQQNALGPSRTLADAKPENPKPTSTSGVEKTCESSICGRATYDGTLVNIYLSNDLSGATHYNFKTIPGAQIEITGHYSFKARPGSSGRYSAQACKRRGISGSTCTKWVTFDWRAS